MAENPINQLRQAFRIPESVTIIAATALRSTNVQKQTAAESFTIDNTAQQDPALYTSKLGTLVMADIEFLPGTYETNTPGIFKDFPGVKYEAVLITVNQAKKIVRTEIQGRDGTVKEYIGLDDFEVTINGVITGINGVRPVEAIDDLKKVVVAPIAIDVVSAYLQALDIDKLVITDYTFEQSEGSYSYQTFSINAISDVPQELRLTNV